MASTAATSMGSNAYQLSDDLARLCLPQEFKDSYRNLAWANSVCALFLAVGLVGIKPPAVHVRKVVPPAEPAQVVIVQPEDLPKPAEVKPQEELELPPEEIQEIPSVVSVVLDTAQPRFARIVEATGPVAVAPTAAMASAPPKNDYIPPATQQAPQAVRFTPNASDTEGGYYPLPEYPRMALKMKQQGTGKVDIVVDESGAVTSVKITESSGYGTLDDAIVQTIKTRWRFPPGRARHFWYPFVFQMGR